VRIAARGPIEGTRDVRPPVDDDGVSGIIHDVPAPDVERLRRLLTGVDAAEEQGDGRVVDQRSRPAVECRLQVSLGDRITALRRERERVVAHIRRRSSRARRRNSRSAMRAGSAAGTGPSGTRSADCTLDLPVQDVLRVDDPVGVPLLGEEPLAVLGEVLVEGVPCDHGVETGRAPVGLGPEDPAQPLRLLLA